SWQKPSFSTGLASTEPSLEFLAGEAYANLPVHKPLQHKRETSTCLRQACRLKSTATSNCPRSTQDRIKHALQAQRKRSNNGNFLLKNQFSPTEYKEPFKFL
ncbi:hypothetical protein, partial [Azotobacter chroococcum]|uniref:hypothetical protein n=1 Tax=Azotobacter chroococcum TaxID=353 RepID=UPI00360878F1